MSGHLNTFDWINFPEGKARFSGATRGWDERGHETFAVEVDGSEYFGEIANAFLPDENNYNIAVVSFGYQDEGYAGSPPPYKDFLTEQLQTVKSLVLQLIGFGTRLQKRPIVLRETATSHFLDKVFFLDSWATERFEDGTLGKVHSSAEEIVR